MQRIFTLIISLAILVLPGCDNQGGASDEAAAGDQPLKALIVDGQNNHVMWPKISVMMKDYLEATGLFTVDIQRTAYTWEGADLIEQYPIATEIATTAMDDPQPDPNFQPDFAAYDVVISNFGWRAAPWPEATQRALEDYVSKGGGLVIVHAADNSWPEWVEFNKMIGLGGWGDRNEKDGPYVYYNEAGELVRDTTAGRGGSHGPRHEFVVQVRDPEHPITKGMPATWLHAEDELYDRLRGPAENMEVLATAYSDPEKKGTGRHEPMILTISYGEGRVFHTPMGHDDLSVSGVGFITTFNRGTEWAATGKVSLPIPEDFPTAESVSVRAYTR